MSAELGFQEWLDQQRGVRYAPLFDTTDDLDVRTHVKGRRQRRLLRRHPAMEDAMIEVVESGLSDPTWRGLLYVMAWGTEKEVRPLYIGMARREGRSRPLSSNLVNLGGDRSKFARWGDGNAYHIGDLSQALFKFASYKKVEAKYRSWAATLFEQRTPPRLLQPVMLLLIPWFDDSRAPSGKRLSVKQVETELIELATAETDGRLLNIMDVPWWTSSRVAAEGTPVYSPQAPTSTVETPEQLEACCDVLTRTNTVGFDVETTFIGRRLCLAQLATPTTNYLVDPLALPDLRSLDEVLEDERVEKIVHNASFERSVMRARGVELRAVYDTLRASRERRGYRVKGGHSLAAVCERELGYTLDKGAQGSDWTRRPLTKRQRSYAAADAEVLLKLGRRLRDGSTLKLPFTYDT